MNSYNHWSNRILFYSFDFLFYPSNTLNMILLLIYTSGLSGKLRRQIRKCNPFDENINIFKILSLLDKKVYLN